MINVHAGIVSGNGTVSGSVNNYGGTISPGGKSAGRDNTSGYGQSDPGPGAFGGAFGTFDPVNHDLGVPCSEIYDGHISYDLVDRAIEIHGTMCDDDARVEIISPPSKNGTFSPPSKLRATLNDQVWEFHLDFVNEVRFKGYAGNDNFTNMTGVRSTADGWDRDRFRIIFWYPSQARRFS